MRTRLDGAGQRMATAFGRRGVIKQVGAGVAVLGILAAGCGAPDRETASSAPAVSPTPTWPLGTRPTVRTTFIPATG